MGTMLEQLIAALLAMIAVFSLTFSYGWGWALLFAVLAGSGAIVLTAGASVLMARCRNP